jgi:hypothetical protein
LCPKRRCDWVIISRSRTSRFHQQETILNVLWEAIWRSSTLGTFFLPEAPGMTYRLFLPAAVSKNVCPCRMSCSLLRGLPILGSGLEKVRAIKRCPRHLLSPLQLCPARHTADRAQNYILTVIIDFLHGNSGGRRIRHGSQTYSVHGTRAPQNLV